MLLCKYCNKEIKNKSGLCCHEPYCKLNPNRIKRFSSLNVYNRTGFYKWNEGISTSIEVKNKISKALIGKSTGIAGSKELEELRKLKISNTMKNNPKAGGIRRGSGRGKKGTYKSYWCDSSWELAWVIYNLDHGIKFERNKQGFEYEFEGKKHKYYPDFILEDGTVVEIKGRRNISQCDEITKCKIDNFKHIKILFDKEIKEYLNYVIEKYGKDFIKMYEK